MVATIAAGTTAQYYTKQSEYYLGGCEPAGRWISATNNFDVVNGAVAERALFERLHAGVDAYGDTLLTNTGDFTKRVAGIDLTLSAPKSVSIAYALADDETRQAIEVAQRRAVEATIAFFDKHASYCRRGKNGLRLERVSITVASFQHGEGRPVAHTDGKVFSDPNLHTHNVILNCAVRADGTIGALDARHLFANKMAAGATYHLVLASGLQRLGFEIGEIGKNGIFEIVGVPRELREYFSARRHEIEEAIAQEGLTSAEAPKLAAAIALGTRMSKREDGPEDRFALWAQQATRFIEVDRFVAALQTYREPHPIDQERAIAERIATVPAQLVEHESLFEKRHLYAAVATALVGTGAGAERVDVEVERLVETGAVVELGRDALDQPTYSTAAQIAIEHDLDAVTKRLREELRSAPDAKRVVQLCRAHGLTHEQTQAALSATTSAAIAIVEGAAGSGKSTMLAAVVAAYRDAGVGMRVRGTATAWKIAVQLGKLGIEAKATDAWLAQARHGAEFLDRNTVLVVDEAGLLSARQMYALLSEVERSGAKAIFVGDRQQLQAVGAGPGLTIVSSVVEASRINTIIRQRHAWQRKAVMDMAKGRAAEGLQAFVDRELLTACDGPKAAVQSLVDAWQGAGQLTQKNSTLLIAKSNAQVRAINNEIRSRLKLEGRVKGAEVEIAIATPSGHTQTIRLAKGDSIRFLLRQDEIGVINGTVATIEQIKYAANPKIKARIGERQVSFRVSDIADEKGRARLAHAYATTIYGCQGLTTDQAFVLLDPSMNRHDLYVAASRARNNSALFFDSRAVDSQIRGELPLSERRNATIESAARLEWLARRLSRLHVKTCTLDPTLTALERSGSITRQQSRSQRHSREMSLE